MEPPDSPMQQSGKHYCPGPIVLLLRLRAWRSHGLACPGISSPVSHRCASPVSAPTEAAVMGELRPASHRHLLSLPQAGQHKNHQQLLRARACTAPPCPCPCRGGGGKRWWRQPNPHVPERGAHCATSAVAHGSRATSCSRTAPGHPPGNICFRLDTPSAS